MSSMNAAEWRAVYSGWRRRGLSGRAAGALSRLGCATPDDARAAGERNLEQMSGIGPATVREIGRNIGGWDGWNLHPLPSREPTEVVIERAVAAIERAEKMLTTRER